MICRPVYTHAHRLLSQRQQTLFILLLTSCIVLCRCFPTSLGLRNTGGRSSPYPYRSENQQILQQTLRPNDSEAIASIQRAVRSPRVPSYRLIECEFPPLDSLNKLNDGSLQSAKMVEDANLRFTKKLLATLTPLLPMLGPPPILLTSSSASNAFQEKAQTLTSNTFLLKNGLPNLKGRDVCILLAPCNSRDYEYAKTIVENGNAVILINGYAKDRKSVSGDATMGYYWRPLTYNSQVAGVLERCYPKPWRVLYAASGNILAEFSDAQILVPETNTPDLRDSVRLVQKAADQRALQKSRSL